MEALLDPRAGSRLRGAFLRQSTLPADLSCANTCALRKAVLVRRAALQPLDTEKARRSLNESCSSRSVSSGLCVLPNLF